MSTILSTLSRLVDDLCDDMSYVLNGGLEGKIQQRQWSCWQRASFWRRRFNLRTFDNNRAVRRRHRKDILIRVDEAAENTNKDKTTRHKKVRAATLIPCYKYLLGVLYFSKNKIYMSAFI